MSLLTMIADVCNEAGLPVPTSVVNATDNTTKALLALTHKVGKILRLKYNWPQLNKEASFYNTGAEMPLPYDFDRFVTRTLWDRVNHWEMQGPLTPQEWQWRKSGIVSTGPRTRYRIKGITGSKFFVDPTTSIIGQQFYYEYQSQNWILPAAKVTGAVYAPNAYVSSNGNIYQTLLGGVAGVSELVSTDGAAENDGHVVWYYKAGTGTTQILYETFQSDTDSPVINERVVGAFILAYHFRAKGLDYSAFMDEAEDLAKKEFINIKGMRTFNEAASTAMRFLGPWNVPDTNYGS